MFLLLSLIMGANPEPRLETRLSPSAAIELVELDVSTLDPIQRLTTRYLYDSLGGVEWVKSQAVNINRISRSYEIYQPVPLANNRLLRVDLAKLVSEESQLQGMIDTWELLRFDPTMNVLLTKDLFTVIDALPVDGQPWGIVKNSGVYSRIPFRQISHEFDVIRITNVPITLIQSLNTFAPLIEGHYFETRALNSIQDKGAYQFIWGGLYYQFKGVPKGKKDQTDEDALFEQLGVGGKGIKAQDIYDKLRSEQRVAMFRSDVTGKPRQIDFLPVLNRRVGDGVSGISITHDVRDQDIETIHHAIMTLRKKSFQDFAREVIWIDANGLNAYALFNNKGALQDEVPPDVAADSSIPNPHTKRLQSGISCIRCHESQGHSGWIPVRNDVQTLLERGAKPFGDVSDPNRSIFDTLRELGSQFKGRPDKFLTQARFSNQSAMVDSSGLWPGKPVDVVTTVSKFLEKSYGEYNFEQVTAKKALIELGFESIPPENATKFLQKLLEPDKNSIVMGILPEDIRIFALTHDIPIYRKDWAMIYAFAQFRAEQQLKKDIKK